MNLSLKFTEKRNQQNIKISALQFMGKLKISQSVSWSYCIHLYIYGALMNPLNVLISNNYDLLVQEACRFYLIESAFALMVAFLINVSVISVSGAVCNSSNLNQEDQASCKDLDLNKASFLLKVRSWSFYNLVIWFLLDKFILPHP